MNTRLHCVSVGHATLDRYAESRVPGGSAWYGARVFSALGARTTLCTAIGPDFPGAREAFSGLDVHRTPSAATTVFTNTHDRAGHRTQHITTTAATVEPPRHGVLGRPDVLFLAPVFGEVEPTAWLDAVPAGLVGLGCQGWLKRRGTGAGDAGSAGDRVVAASWAVPDGVLWRVHVACLSVEDVAGDETLLNRLIRRVPLVALTLGARGCLLFEEGVARHVPAEPAREVDPTGAGDTFAAGLLFALARGAEPRDAARLAARCAARVVEGRGGERLSSLSALRPRESRPADSAESRNGCTIMA